MDIDGIDGTVRDFHVLRQIILKKGVGKVRSAVFSRLYWALGAVWHSPGNLRQIARDVIDLRQISHDMPQMTIYCVHSTWLRVRNWQHGDL